MNNKILTIAALAAVLVAGIFATTPMAAMTIAAPPQKAP